MPNCVIIVAGGNGTRMGSDLPKQFMLLEDKPVLMRTISCFLQYDSSITVVVVLPELQISYWKELCEKYSFHTAHQVVKGGDTRFMSVKNGLEAVNDAVLVAIHDGVRPLVSQNTIDRCFGMAAKSGSAIPVLPVKETLRTGTLENSKTVDRSGYYSVQTPQVFRTEIIRESYAQDWNDSFTDDASVVEKKGFHVMMVSGNPENLKITHPIDLLIASEYIKSKKDRE
jgi:2-C-methyl-D-erythritol 4-phosphate cytidylyltransferase